MNTIIDQKIVLPIVAPHMLLTPATKELVADAALGGTLVNRTPRKVIRTGIGGSTPGENFNSVSVEHCTSPVLTGMLPLPHPVASAKAYRL